MIQLCPYVSENCFLVVLIQVLEEIEQDLLPGGKQTISAFVFFCINILLEVFGINIQIGNLSGESVYNRTINRNVVKVKCFYRCVILDFREEMLLRLSKKRRKMREIIFRLSFFCC